MRHRYEYWVVRYVPDAIRGEFVNIGVIAGDGDEWAIRRVSNLSRASRLGGSATVSKSFLQRIEKMVDSELEHMEVLVGDPPEVFERGYIEDLRTRMNNSVQLSRARAVLASSAHEAADLAFRLMVVDSEKDVQHRTRTLALNRLRHAFDNDPALQGRVRTRKTVAVGPETTRIDFAVEDGAVRQLSQAWAFDIDPKRIQTQIRAWNYMMGRLRDRGGDLFAKVKAGPGDVLEIPGSVKINAVYAPPSSEEGAAQLDLAIQGWRDLDVRPVKEGDSELVVQQARQLVSS